MFCGMWVSGPGLRFWFGGADLWLWYSAFCVGLRWVWLLCICGWWLCDCGFLDFGVDVGYDLCFGVWCDVAVVICWVLSGLVAIAIWVWGGGCLFDC